MVKQLTRDETIVRDSTNGMTNADIAKKHNLSESDVRALLRHVKEHPLVETSKATGATEAKPKLKKKRPGQDYGKPHYYIDNAGKHRWTIISKNNEIFGSSHQGFATEAEAKQNYKRVRRIK